MSGYDLDYEAVFDATPTPYLVLAPDLAIVAMNRARELVTGRRREEVIGLDVFEAFPDNPEDPTATGVANLRASLERVLATKQPDTMPVQKYDLVDPASDRSSSGGGPRSTCPFSTTTVRWFCCCTG